jgi:hypothetical protein
MSPNKALQPTASRRSLWRFEKEMQRSRRLSSTVGPSEKSLARCEKARALSACLVALPHFQAATMTAYLGVRK